MSSLFLNILEMSVMGSVVILITMLIRQLLRKRSKRFILILWAVVVLRLMIPVSIESPLSIFNLLPSRIQNLSAVAQAEDAADPDSYSVEIKETAIHSADAPEAGLYVEADSGKEAFIQAPVPSGTDSDKIPLPDIMAILPMVWLAGTIFILSYCSVRYIMLKIKLKDAKNTGGNIYESDKIKAPFVFGLFSPRIYLPDVLDNNEREYILIHEKTHIRHGDWLSKMIGMAVVAVHWFNPLVWLAYALFEQDIEMSCDEATVSGMSPDRKQAYAMSIVYYAKRNNSKRYLVTPLGFSKVNFSKSEVSKRVKNIINYKKGKTITSVLILGMLLTVAVACSLNPDKTGLSEEPNVTATESVISAKTNGTSSMSANTHPADTQSGLLTTEEPGKTTLSRLLGEDDEDRPVLTDNEFDPAESSDPADADEPLEDPAPVLVNELGEIIDPELCVTSMEEMKSGLEIYIEDLVGCEYKFGGEYTDGFDSSGLIVYCYKYYFAVALPHSTNSLSEYGVDVNLSDIQAGDIILFDKDNDGYYEHAALCAGNGKYVHALPDEGVVEDNLSTASGIAKIKRIVSFDEDIHGLG